MAWWEDASKTGRRWIFKNLSGETIPGFACIGLDPYQAADLHSTASIALWDKDARCLQARQPNAVHEDLQNPRLIAFNLQDPVIKDSWGFCTFDKPAIALVDRNERLYVGDQVGPRAGCWHLSKVGDAFVYLGSDPADPFDWKETLTLDGEQVPIHYGTCMVDAATGYNVLHARTVELEDENYPSGNILPIELLSTGTSSGTATFAVRGDFSSPLRAVAPCGWLPPGTDVDVIRDGLYFRIVRWPTTLCGYATADVAAASGNPCQRRMNPANATVQIAKRISGKYVPQSYTEGSQAGTPVLTTWYNWCANPFYELSFLAANIDRDNVWLIESCCECDGPESCSSESEPSSSEPSSSPSSSEPSSSPSSSIPSSEPSSQPSSQPSSEPSPSASTPSNSTPSDSQPSAPSEPSTSVPLSSEPSSVPSSGPSSGPSSAPSTPSGSVPSGSEPSTPSTPLSQSDKSTAIVPAAWSPTGYTAWFTLEAPDVRFDDVLTEIDLTESETHVPIDMRYLDGCDPSVPVSAIVSAEDVPVMLAAKVEGGCVRVRMRGNEPGEKVRVVIRLSGIRKGFAGHRFPSRTRAQFEANERFLQSAYPGAGR